MHASLLAIGLWGAAIWLWATPGPFTRLGQLKGIDFSQFYAAAVQARIAPSELYSAGPFVATLRRVTPGAGSITFLPIYPPQVALALIPIGWVPFGVALAIWLAFSVAVYVTAVSMLVRLSPRLARDRAIVFLCAAAFPPIVLLLLHGQFGAVPLLLLTLAFVSLRAGRPWLAGVLLGGLACKPQFLVPVFAIVAAAGELRIVLGGLVSVLAQVLAVTVAFGWAIVTAYARAASHLLQNRDYFEPRAWNMHSLRSFFELLAGPGWIATAAWLASAATVVLVTAIVWRQAADRGLAFAMLVLAAVLVNPHLYAYDLVVLVIPVLLLIEWSYSQPSQVRDAVYWSTYALFPAIVVSGPVARFVHVQVSVLVIAALLCAGAWDRFHRDRGMSRRGMRVAS